MGRDPGTRGTDPIQEGPIIDDERAGLIRIMLGKMTAEGRATMWAAMQTLTVQDKEEVRDMMNAAALTQDPDAMMLVQQDIKPVSLHPRRTGRVDECQTDVPELGSEALDTDEEDIVGEFLGNIQGGSAEAPTSNPQP